MKQTADRAETVRKLKDGSAVIGIIGLGHVGLPLSIAFSRKYRVFGFDSRPDHLSNLRSGDGRSQEVTWDEITKATNSGLTLTNNMAYLRDCDFVIIAVGTPLAENKNPDLSQVENAAREVALRLRPGQVVILESTTYPGTTEEVLLPILESSGRRLGTDFEVAYSPERIDPGDPAHKLEHIPKLVGGLSPESTELASELYRSVVEKVVPVSHARVAEAAKLLENLFRSVNIALVNEVALIMERLGIDAWEAIDAASTKPFGFMPFYPGPGVGGHCIPLDPYYLSYRARKAGYFPVFIELSGELSEQMKSHTVDLLKRGLAAAGKNRLRARVTVLGLSFKRNVADTRESPAIDVMEECRREGLDVRAYDPHVSGIRLRHGTIRSSPTIEAAVSGADGCMILVDHDEFASLNYDKLTQLMSPPGIWVDMRHVLLRSPKGSVALGVGRPNGKIPD